MRNSFTRKFAFAFLIVLLSLADADVAAQATFTVDAPASLAGEDPAIVGLFGQNNGGTMVSGEIVVAEDGDATFVDGEAGSTADACQPVSNDVSGKIVLTDRTFVCNSFQASLNTEGAIAMLVCPNNNSPDYRNQVAPRGNSRDSELPVFSLSFERCEEIKASITGGETVTGTYNVTCEVEAPDGAIWGTTFGNGAADWIFAGDGWVYNEDGYMGAGAITGGALDADGNRTGNFGYALTTTACDGALVYDADFLDNGGNRDSEGDIAFGTGECPCVGFDGFFLPEPQRCFGTVTSPSIDISGNSGELIIQFQQEVRDFLGQYFVDYSYDGGTVWDTTEINTELEQAGPITIENQTVSLCDAQGAENLLIRFRHRSGYYFWVIDDLYVIDRQVVDVQGNNSFASTPPSFRTPVSQLDIYPFLIDVENYGNATAEDVSVTVSITDAQGAEVYTDTKSYGEIEQCFLAENDAFADIFDMEDAGLGVGTYTTTYSVSSANSTVGDSPERTRSWEITSDVFSKCLSAAELGEDLGNFGAPTITEASFGNHYYFTDDAAPVSVRTGLAFQGGDNDVTEFIADLQVQVFIWIDDNGNGQVDDDERELVAEGFEEVESSRADLGDFEVELDLEGDGLIPGGSDVIVIGHVQALDPLDYPIRFKAASTEDFRDFDYSALALASDTLGVPRYGSFIAVGGGPVDERVFTWTNAQNLAVYMPLTITPISSVEESINDGVVASIFPNPASELINIEMNLVEASEDVQVSLMDVTGKIAATQIFSDVKTETLSVNIAGLSTGSYIVKIRTDEGVTSRKVLIIE